MWLTIMAYSGSPKDRVVGRFMAYKFRVILTTKRDDLPMGPGACESHKVRPPQWRSRRHPTAPAHTSSAFGSQGPATNYTP